MREDRTRWNDKYRSERHPTEPVPAVARFYGLAPGRKALDLAAGSGRHAVFLAKKGFSVDAVDISEVGLSMFAGRLPGINAVCADLDEFEIPAARYDLIVNVKFLNRRLFPYIQEGLSPGGVVIFHSLLEPAGDASAAGHCRDYLLRRNELLHAFLGLRIVYYCEKLDSKDDRGDETATLVAVKERAG